ncbi:MAG: TNT domain-containing protein, partial [Desulfobacterales bacterium]
RDTSAAIRGIWHSPKSLKAWEGLGVAALSWAAVGDWIKAGKNISKVDDVLKETSGQTKKATNNAGIQNYYPENNGFLGVTEKKFLMEGDKIDRFGGSDYSRFFSPEGTPGWARSLPSGSENQPLRTFEVLKPFEVEKGTVAPAFGKLGLGIQYKSPVKMKTLIDRDIIREITP